MRVQRVSLSVICGLAAVAVFAADNDIAGKWATDEAVAVIAERQQRGRGQARPKNDNPPPAITMDLSLDGKKTKVTGMITEAVSGTMYQVEEGKADGKKFTFKTKPSPSAAAVSWSGELKDNNTLTLSRLDPKGSPVGDPMIFHRSQ